MCILILSYQLWEAFGGDHRKGIRVGELIIFHGLKFYIEKCRNMSYCFAARTRKTISASMCIRTQSTISAFKHLSVSFYMTQVYKTDQNYWLNGKFCTVGRKFICNCLCSCIEDLILQVRR